MPVSSFLSMMQVDFDKRRCVHQFPGWLTKRTALEVPLCMFCNTLCLPFFTPCRSFPVCYLNLVSLPLLGTFQSLFPSLKTSTWAVYIKYIKLCVCYLVRCIAGPHQNNGCAGSKNHLVVCPAFT